MKNIKTKKLILTIFAVLYFVITNICIYYGYKYMSEYYAASNSFLSEGSIVGMCLIYTLLSSLFYFLIIYLYEDSENAKLKTFFICAICLILHLVYAIVNIDVYKVYGTLSYTVVGKEITIMFLTTVYLLVWAKINWLVNTKNKLLNLNINKKSRKKKNIVLSILNFLIENPLVLIFILLQIIILSTSYLNRYDMKYVIEEGEIPILLIVFALALVSLVQLAIVLALNAFCKNKHAIKGIVVVTIIVLICMPNLMGYDFFQYHFDFYNIKKQIVKSINEKKNASEHKKEVEEALKNGSKKYLSNFEVADDIDVAKTGQVVKFGKTFVKNEMSNKEDAYYFVLNKEDNVLTLVSLYCIDVIDNDFIYKNGSKGYYDYLDNEYYKNAFNDKEKSMIVDIEAEDKSKHKVYIPNTKELLLLKSKNDKASLGVVNDTLLKEIRKHYKVFNDYYFRGELKYLIEPHILKPNTIRMRACANNSLDVIHDYDEKKSLDVYGMWSFFLRTKIMVDVSK